MERAEVVVAGAGCLGASAAYRLAQAGVDVLLLDRGEPGAGSTIKAAGGVRAQFSDEVNIALAARSLAQFGRFEAELGQAIDLHTVGYLFLLSTGQDVADFERAVERQNALGVPSRMLSVEEAVALSPYVVGDGLLGAAFHAGDGHCDPASVVAGYLRAARALGARVRTGTPVTGMQRVGERVTAVETAEGPVACDGVVVAAGAWSREVGAHAGVDLPVTPLRRQILVTEQVPGKVRGAPMTIDHATSFYFHDEGDALLVGMSDPEEEPGFDVRRHDRWLPRLAAAIERRTPALAGIGIRTGWAGLYEMTPDHNGLVGRSGNVVYATGFSGHGFLMAPAVGEVVRDLWLRQDAVVDVSTLAADRDFGAAPVVERHIV